MPSAIVTVRELKNKETGIDISIPVHKEVKGLLQSSWEFYVVVVSNLPYFKSAKHKDTDVVQFMVPKKFADFESLHAKLTEKYPATILPNLPKKQLITTEAVIKERKLTLEKFLQFIATTNKLVNSFVFLEFLGVNAIKAGKFRKDLEDTEESPTKGDNQESEDPQNEREQPPDLFDEEEESVDVDLFGVDEFAADNDDDDIDIDVPLPTVSGEDDGTKLFEDPDLRGGIDEGDEDLFVPGSAVPALVTKKTTVLAEDNSDLFTIEDDLDRFEIKDEEKGDDREEDIIDEPKHEIEADEPDLTSKPTIPEKPSVPNKPNLPKKPTPSQKPSISQKPNLPQKPSLPAKPSLSKPEKDDNDASPETVTIKPKPAPRPKPKQSETPSNNSPVIPEITGDNSSRTETVKPKPAPRPKPKLPETTANSSVKPEITKNSQSSKDVQSLETDDIMKYIVDNTENEEDVDLFS